MCMAYLYMVGGCDVYMVGGCDVHGLFVHGGWV